MLSPSPALLWHGLRRKVPGLSFLTGNPPGRNPVGIRSAPRSRHRRRKSSRRRRSPSVRSIGRNHRLHPGRPPGDHRQAGHLLQKMGRRLQPVGGEETDFDLRPGPVGNHIGHCSALHFSDVDPPSGRRAFFTIESLRGNTGRFLTEDFGGKTPFSNIRLLFFFQNMSQGHRMGRG